MPERHILTAVAPGYRPMEGELELRPSGQQTIRFVLDPLEEPEEIRPERLANLRQHGFMLVQGFVVDEASGELLAGATVSTTPGGAQTSTDSLGFFRIFVPAPEEVNSDEAESTLLVEKPGFTTHLRHSLELWSGGDCTYRLRLKRGGGTELLDERTTRRRAPRVNGPTGPTNAATPERRSSNQLDTPEPQPTTLPANSTVRVPRNIRVLNGDGTTIDYVSLTYYTRAVLGSEWIASWGSILGGTNSLNAGAVAVRCYAIYKLNAVGPTSNYDICGTTSCQVYNPAKIHSLTDAAVNHTLDWVLLSGTNIANTEYSAENNSLDLEGVTSFSCADGFTAPTGGCLYDPICAGQDRYGHGRGMCQWGTARWATGRKMNGRSSGDSTPSGYARRDWKWIVQHYYPALLLAKGASLVVGDDVKAMRTLDVRGCPGGNITNGTSCALITTKPANATGVIVEGPMLITADGKGFTWYKVQWNDTSMTAGWSVENYLERVYAIPTAPMNLTASANATNRITLNWADPTDVEAGFVLERAPAPTGPFVSIAVLNANATTFADTNLLEGNTWHYRLKAYNSGGSSGYSSVASATTPVSAPLLGPATPETVPEETLLRLDIPVMAPDRLVELARFDHFMSETANGAVMFRDPLFSGSTSALLESVPNISTVTDSFPTDGYGTGSVLRIQCSFSNVATPWLRLTTANPGALANPVIDLTKKLRFRIYADRTIRLGLGIRETSTALGTAIGENGGQVGGIEWAGVTNVAGGAPVPARIIPGGAWTVVSFDLPGEPVRNFSGGNGVLSSASGLGVLEHLAIVPQNGAGVYNLFLDDFVVAYPRQLDWSLGPEAPSGVSIDATGVVSWIPTEAQGAGTYPVQVMVSDDSIPVLRATNSYTVQVAEVNRPPVLLVPKTNLIWHAGAMVTLTNSAADLDLPANDLVFSLDPGFPPGAGIHPATGVFTWQTSQAAAGSTNEVTIRVTDNGLPVASVATPVRILLRPAPSLSIRPGGPGEVTLSWEAIAGTTYLIEFKNDLSDPAWLKLEEVVATETSLSIPDSPGVNQRFYRITAQSQD